MHLWNTQLSPSYTTSKYFYWGIIWHQFVNNLYVFDMGGCAVLFPTFPVWCRLVLQACYRDNFNNALRENWFCSVMHGTKQRDTTQICHDRWDMSGQEYHYYTKLIHIPKQQYCNSWDCLATQFKINTIIVQLINW